MYNKFTTDNKQTTIQTFVTIKDNDGYVCFHGTHEEYIQWQWITKPINQ